MYMLPTIAFQKPNPNETHITQESYRLSEDRHREINEVLKNYIGTKNYHNFTSKKKPLDPSCKRHMFSFICEPPFVRKGVEFVVLKVKGQSFMLHQIRKMVALVLAIMRGYIDMELFNKAFTTEKLNIPRVPGLGLVLEFVHFDRYDYRYSTDGVHENLKWESHTAEIEEFKEEHIYPIIVSTEVNEKLMLTWISEKLSEHDFTQLEADDDKGHETNVQDADNDEQEDDDGDVTETGSEKVDKSADGNLSRSGDVSATVTH